MAAVAKLQAILAMDSSEFKAGMKGAKAEASSFQSQIKGVGKVIAGAFSVGAIISAGKSLVTWAGDISEAAQNAGLLTSEMMALNEISVQGGLNVDEMRRMLSKMQVELFNAASGSDETRKKFEDMGLSVEKLVAMSPADALREISKAAFDSGIPLQRIADIFGDKLGPKAVSALRDLADNGFPAVDAAAAKTADEIENLGDKWDAFMERIKRGTLSGVAKAFSAYEQAQARTAGEKEYRKSIGKLELPFQSVSGLTAAETEQMKAAGQRAVDNLTAKKSTEDEAKARETELARMRQSNELFRQNELTKEKQFQEELKKLKGETETAKGQRDAQAEKVKDAQRKSAEKRTAGFEKAREITASAEEKERTLREGIAGLSDPMKAGASQIRQDNMASVGGFFGNGRAGYDVASQQLQTQHETNAILEEIRKLNVETAEALRQARGER